VKGFGVEFAFGPTWKTIHHITLAHVLPSGARAVGWFGELVFKRLVRTHAYQKNATTILRNAIIFGIQHRPFHSVTRRPVPD
jgi:hypothetical protein